MTIPNRVLLAVAIYFVPNTHCAFHKVRRAGVDNSPFPFVVGTISPLSNYHDGAMIARVQTPPAIPANDCPRMFYKNVWRGIHL